MGWIRIVPITTDPVCNDTCWRNARFKNLDQGFEARPAEPLELGAGTLFSLCERFDITTAFVRRRSSRFSQRAKPESTPIFQFRDQASSLTNLGVDVLLVSAGGCVASKRQHTPHTLYVARTQLSQDVLTPRECGTTWSMLPSFGESAWPVYWQTPPSRSQMPRAPMRGRRELRKKLCHASGRNPQRYCEAPMLGSRRSARLTT